MAEEKKQNLWNKLFGKIKPFVKQKIHDNRAKIATIVSAPIVVAVEKNYEISTPVVETIEQLVGKLF